MDKSTLKRLNALKKKLKEWEKEGYDVSPLKEDIEAFERQEAKKKARKVVLFTFLVLAVIGGGISIGINYHQKQVQKQIAMQQRLRQEEEARRQAEEEARRLREKAWLIRKKARQDSIRLAEKLKKEREAKKKTKNVRKKVSRGLVYLRTNSKGYKEYKNKKDGSVLIYIPAGEFTMGSNNGDSDEKPVHKVYLDGYYIGKYEVTVAQFRKFCNATGHKMPEQPSWNGDNHPVVDVSWSDAVAYCRWAGLRLPTEAEWEKAARGTDGRKYPWGNSLPSAGGYKANYDCYDENDGSDHSIYRRDGYEYTSPVGSFPSGISPYGCYDMAGNVWEWCSDWYGEHYYRDSPYRNPKGPDSGSSRVFRGGSWYNFAWRLRCTNRDRCTPVLRYNYLGFRVAR